MLGGELALVECEAGRSQSDASDTQDLVNDGDYALRGNQQNAADEDGVRPGERSYESFHDDSPCCAAPMFVNHSGCGSGLWL